jgi:hypothetical protein
VLQRCLDIATREIQRLQGVIEMAEQVPSVGRVVHFVYGDTHVPAIVTEPEVRTPDPIGGVDMVWEALTVFPVGEPPFTTVAAFDPGCSPATWHWPEFVPPKG